ncbi:hypothetical protein [Asticcacaulis sp.]|uniref:hypothetical protein n=1 Tax=Asticcacaulis sp. TaxID=1872648 RepID=UPI002635FF68|nr:hypothetical protein [Asticcacaulis sp.]
MAAKTHLFWDSCVFYAYFSNNTAAYDLSGIEQYIEEAKNGAVVIHTCSVSLAEVVPSAFVGGSHGSFQDFLKDFRGTVRLVDLNPNVMLMAGRLKDLPYRKTGGTRMLGTGDAVMLAACIHLVENYGVAVDAFHTCDAGKKRGLDGGRGMPLLGYEEWCEGFDATQMALAQKVIDLKRCNPVHPTPSLLHVREAPVVQVPALLTPPPDQSAKEDADIVEEGGTAADEGTPAPVPGNGGSPDAASHPPEDGAKAAAGNDVPPPVEAERAAVPPP